MDTNEPGAADAAITDGSHKKPQRAQKFFLFVFRAFFCAHFFARKTKIGVVAVGINEGGNQLRLRGVRGSSLQNFVGRPSSGGATCDAVNNSSPAR
jgi:hypothetical protein